MMILTTAPDRRRKATFDTSEDLRGRIFLSVVDTYENVDLNRGSFNDISNRVRVSTAQVLHGRPAVILIFGQSKGLIPAMRLTSQGIVSLISTCSMAIAMWQEIPYWAPPKAAAILRAVWRIC